MSTGAQFVISSIRILDPAGEPAAPPRAFAHDPAELVALYRAMALTRAFDAEAVGLQRTDRLGRYASSLGQKAVAVGLVAARRASDVQVPSFVNGGAVAAAAKIAGLAQRWRLYGGGERCIDGTASDPVKADLGRLARVVNRFHAICGQAIGARPEAMTTVRERRDAVVLPQGDLRREFVARLAAAAAPAALNTRYSKQTTASNACLANR